MAIVGNEVSFSVPEGLRVESISSGAESVMIYARTECPAPQVSSLRTVFSSSSRSLHSHSA